MQAFTTASVPISALPVHPNRPLQLYGYGERIFRLMALRGIVSTLFERILLWIYECFAQRTLRPKLFDSARELKGEESLKHLGGVLFDLKPEDGFANLKVMHLKSKSLNQRIESLGGKWLRHVGKEHAMYIVVPPSKPTAEWKALESDMRHLRWSVVNLEVEGLSKSVIVTCPNADHVSEGGEELFAHHSSSSPTFAMLTRRIGFVLGMKRDILLYNPRGVGRSEGIPSEAGFYSDAKCIWKWLKENNYANEKTWFSSACGGGYRTGYLFAELPEVRQSGVNWLWENGTVVARRDWIDVQSSSIARWLGHKIISGLECRDIPVHLRPKETGYDLEVLYPVSNGKAAGRCIVVGPAKDKLFARKHVINFAKKRFSHVDELTFDSDVHDARFFHQPESSAQVISKLFQS